MLKTLVYSAFLLAPALAHAQTEPFVVKGKLSAKAGISKAYLNYTVDKTRLVDSADVKNGRFAFRGNLAQPVAARLTVVHPGATRLTSEDVTEVYLEKGTIRVAGKDSVTQARVSGTPLNQENAAVQVALKPLNDQYKAGVKAWRALPAEQQKDPAVTGPLEARLDGIETQQKEVWKGYVQAHPASRFSLFALQRYGGPLPDVAPYAALYEGLAPAVRATPHGQRIADQIKRRQRVAVGAIAPDFTQNDPDNKPVRLSDLRGQYVLLDFWASWCGPCRRENPNVVRAYTAYKDKGFTVLGVSLDKETGREAWLKAIKNDALTWTQVSDLKFWQNAVAQDYDVLAIPQNFLIDPTGKIVGANLRGEELQTTLARLLATVK